MLVCGVFQIVVWKSPRSFHLVLEYLQNTNVKLLNMVTDRNILYVSGSLRDEGSHRLCLKQVEVTKLVSELSLTQQHVLFCVSESCNQKVIMQL